MKVLPETQYLYVKEYIEKLDFNTYFAQSVIERHSKGMVFVDNIDTPKAFYIVSDYGMALLLGEVVETFKTELFNYLDNILGRSTHFIQASSQEWQELLGSYCEQKGLDIYTRINFQFDKEIYFKNRKLPKHSYQIEKIQKEDVENINGIVVPKKFWKNGELFSRYGNGSKLMDNEVVASVAFSAYVSDGILEIGIETFENYQRKGLAQIVCRMLIDECLNNDIEPVWACKLENTGSYNLAIQLGFVPKNEFPYYII